MNPTPIKRGQAQCRPASRPIRPDLGRRFIGVEVDQAHFKASALRLSPSESNVGPPVETIKLLDRVAPKGNRSRLISEAVLHYLDSKAKGNLPERLKAGALANAGRDLEIAQEWFPFDEEAWQRSKPAERCTR
jgi:hypothetical protein